MVIYKTTHLRFSLTLQTYFIWATSCSFLKLALSSNFYCNLIQLPNQNQSFLPPAGKENSKHAWGLKILELTMAQPA